jgi:hypothetical protein
MPYASHFASADNVISSLRQIVSTTTDPLLVGQYTGFAAVSAVTVYELAIKTIFVDFGRMKHKVLGTFVDSYFDRINGRISLKTLKEDYVPRFGQRYVDRFNRLLEKREQVELRANGISIRSSYGNIIAWRNEFAHEGRVPTNATFAETERAYDAGKCVLDCLALAMVR